MSTAGIGTSTRAQRQSGDEKAGVFAGDTVLIIYDTEFRPSTPFCGRKSRLQTENGFVDGKGFCD
jgi:hypothetical protein